MTDRRDETGQPGWYVGPDRDPGYYRLDRLVHRGGEGVLWRATRSEGDVWAVKVLLGKHLDRGDDETLDDSLRRWEGIWDRTIERTAKLRDIRGVVPVVRAFQAAAPHPGSRPHPGGTRTLCLVSPWLDGQDLRAWQRGRRRDRTELVDVICQLAHLADQLADHGQVHRDISPGNVMVDARGRVSLVDFSFMRDTGATVTHIVGTSGYRAPEWDILPANDRYSVGAIACLLLTGTPPPAGGAAPAARYQLIDSGHSSALADHVAALLDADPAGRPDRLGTWADRFRELVVRRPATLSYADLALEPAGSGRTEVVVAGAGPVGAGRSAPTAHLRLVTDEDGPRDTVSIAAAHRGDGDVVVFAAGADRRIRVRAGRRWQPLPALAASGPIRAAANPHDGSARAFVTTDGGTLAAITVAVHGPPSVTDHDVRARRVLACCTGADGRAVVLVEAYDGELLCGPPEDLTPVGLRQVVAADVTTNQWGDLVCAAARPDLVVVEQVAGAWDAPQPLPAPPGVRDVACTGHRDGVTLAVATDVGLLVSRLDDGDWTALHSAGCSRVVTGMGAGWQVQVAALSGPRLLFATESAPGDWLPDSAAEV